MFGFMEGGKILLSPLGDSGGGRKKGDRKAAKKPAPKPGAERKAAKSKTPPAKSSKSVRATADDDDIEDDDDIDIDEDEDVEDEDDDDIDDEDDDDDDDIDDEDDDDDDDDDEEDEDDDDASLKRQRIEKAKRKQQKEKQKKKATLAVPKSEWKQLKEKAGAADKAEQKRLQQRAQLQAEREDRIAAEDGVKALEMTRKRLTRDISSRDEQIRELSNRAETLESRLKESALRAGFDEAIRGLAERGDVRIRKGALPHIRKALSDRFEAIEADDSEGEYVVLDRETGEPIEDMIEDIFESDEFALFLEGDSESTEEPDVRGTNRPRKRKREEKPSYAAAYKKQLKELESAGVKPAIGLRPKAS